MGQRLSTSTTSDVYDGLLNEPKDRNVLPNTSNRVLAEFEKTKLQRLKRDHDHEINRKIDHAADQMVKKLLKIIEKRDAMYKKMEAETKNQGTTKLCLTKNGWYFEMRNPMHNFIRNDQKKLIHQVKDRLDATVMSIYGDGFFLRVEPICDKYEPFFHLYLVWS